MNRTHVRIFVVSLLLMLPSFAFAIDGGHDITNRSLYSSGQTCNSTCHKGNAVTYLYPVTNVCLSCHNGTTYGTSSIKVKSFNPTDYANISGIADGRVSPKQTSHRWDGPDTLPAAKALPPVDPYALNPYGMNRNGYANRNACSRCHAVHSDSQNTDPVDYDQSKQPPYVRALNTKDQMCLDCHRQRNSQTSLAGTHPVMVSYTSASVKGKTTEFRQGTPYQNAANSTAEMKNKRSMVVCSSCHGVHYADSDSATFDNHSGSASLSASNGSLLRVSLRGANNGVDTINLCTNCHIKKHSGQINQHTKSTVIQCVDCHNAHIDNDGVATPNKYIIRNYMNYSGVKGSVSQTAGYSRRVVFNDTDTRWARPDNTGVCQACHTIPNGTQNHTTYISIADGPTQVTQCRGCHTTNAPHTDAAPVGGCTDCHGQPPVDVATTAAGYTGYAEATTPHSSHASGGTNYSYSCTECHNGNSHNTGTYADVFINKTGIKAGASASYARPSCSTVYCHSDGNGVYKTVSWNGTKGSILGVGGATECNACHDNRTTTFTGSHQKHVVTRAYGCETCHSSTVSNSTTVSNKGNHVNAIKEVAFSGTGAATGTSSAPNCTVACHSNGKGVSASPVWGTASTGACGTCHATAVNGALATGSHQTHFTVIGTGDSSCNSCHTTYTGVTGSAHVNGALDSPANTSCQVCHADPYSTAIATPPTWGTSASGCSACHSAHPITATGPATGSHTTVTGHAVACTTCHATGTSATTSPSTGHADGNIDVANVGYATLNKTKGTAGTTCSAASCHVSPVGTALIVTPAWGTTGNGCAACHSGANAITATGPATGSHTTVTGHAVACTTCHATGTTATTSPSTGHADGNIDVANVGYTLNKTKGSAGTTCSAASCHVSPVSTALIVTPAWGTTGNGCAACHSGANAITATGPATGSHTTVTGHAVACTTCHATGTSATTSPSTGHADGDIDVANVGYTLNKTKGTAGTTCSTASCHGSLSPAWGANTTNTTCTKCHGTGSTTVTTATEYLVAPTDAAATDTGKVSANTKIGAHQTHLQYFNGLSQQGTDAAARCQVCHGTLPVSGSHANGTSAPVFQGLAKKDGSAFTATYTAGTSSCAVYCHNPAGTGGTVASGNAGTGTAPVWTNATYIADGTLKTATTCDRCHLSPNGSRTISATYNHSAVTLASDCTSCHGHNGGTGGTTGQQHIDGTLYGAGGSCNGCHDYDTVGSTYSSSKWTGGTWGKSGTDFGGYVAAGSTVAEGFGAHAKHINHIKTRAGITVAMATAGAFGSGQAAQVCGTCHTNTSGNHNMSGITGDTTGRMINFGDNTFQIGGAGSSLFGASNPIYNGASGTRGTTQNKTCSNLSCHYFTTPQWSTY